VAVAGQDRMVPLSVLTKIGEMSVSPLTINHQDMFPVGDALSFNLSRLDASPGRSHRRESRMRKQTIAKDPPRSHRPLYTRESAKGFRNVPWQASSLT